MRVERVVPSRAARLPHRLSSPLPPHPRPFLLPPSRTRRAGGSGGRLGLCPRARQGDEVAKLPRRVAPATTTSPPPPLIYHHCRGHGGPGAERARRTTGKCVPPPLLRRKNNTSDNEGTSSPVAHTANTNPSNPVPFLPVRDDFHPKRNQARQKLATLPTGRFKDLSSDVYYELARRYPEFKEEVCTIFHI